LLKHFKAEHDVPPGIVSGLMDPSIQTLNQFVKNVPKAEALSVEIASILEKGRAVALSFMRPNFSLMGKPTKAMWVDA
jgi:hypothetical protein